MVVRSAGAGDKRGKVVDQVLCLEVDSRAEPLLLEVHAADRAYMSMAGTMRLEGALDTDPRLRRPSTRDAGGWVAAGSLTFA